MWNFKKELYRVYNGVLLSSISCSAGASSGGVGVTEYIIPLENSLGGIVIMDFSAQGVVDKLEIIHNGIKKATTGMTTVNAGPFDDLYGNPTVPTSAQATATDQFIGLDKGTIPTRDAVFLSETGITDVTRLKQQLIWWVYSPSHYTTIASVIIRVTGPSGTAWDLTRLCTAQTPTGITPSSYMYAVSNPGRATSALACAEVTFPFNIYASVNVLEIGVRMFTNADLSTPLAGADLWYQYGVNGVSIQINNTGYITTIVTC